ncbi:MAG: FkbM family methyltransferase [Limnoraphis sp. WC205]|jgi:FkbM family methyltransferase|nr:FkbM family methyltransferase [Limnoraphis sp. WC205]
MKHHSIFETFQCVKSIGTGKHIFDFLGVATDVTYKKAWSKYAVSLGSQYTSNYPVVNEHYFDWIALLQSVRGASGVFRMAELGAGWAPWLVRAAFAARQVPGIEQVELVGVEADPTHYRWMKSHFLDNKLNPEKYHLLNGAVAPKSMSLQFPKLDDPDEDYGASLNALSKNGQYVEVQGYPLTDMLELFTGPVDFIHMDIQGAEYDVIPGAMKLLKSHVKAMMVGTHISLEKHNELHQLFLDYGWKPVMVFPRNSEIETEFGKVAFGDGFLFYQNSSFIA